MSAPVLEEAVGRLAEELERLRQRVEAAEAPIHSAIAIYKLLAKEAEARAEAAGASLTRARADAIEDAAMVADKHLGYVPGHHPDMLMSDLVSQGYGNAALNIAKEIRHLSSRPVEAGTTDPWCYDMEKAPKDGRGVLICAAGGGMILARWDRLMGDWDAGDFESLLCAPMAWAPLPAPPSPRPPATGEVTQ